MTDRKTTATASKQAPISPDCEQRKCGACYGDAWDLVLDQPAECSCSCHKEA